MSDLLIDRALDETSTTTDHEARPAGRWPLWGLAAGATGLFATWFSSQMVSEEAKAQGVDAVYRELDGAALVGAGARAGFVSMLCLLIFAAGLFRLLERRGAGDTLALPVLKMAIPAAAGAMVVVWSLKAMLAGGMPGSIDESLYTSTDVTVLHLLVDQLQWVPWIGVVVGAGAVAVLSLKERALPRWLGWVSIVATVLVAVMTVGFALPYSAGVVAPFWLVVASLGLLRPARQG